MKVSNAALKVSNAKKYNKNNNLLFDNVPCTQNY